MVFQRKNDPSLCCEFNASGDRFNAPFETVLLLVSFKDGLDTTRFHQVVEGLDCFPPARVQADARNAECIGDLDAFFGMINPLLPFSFVGRDEVLMDREADEIDSSP